jgi:hypothetical protein
MGKYKNLSSWFAYMLVVLNLRCTHHWRVLNILSQGAKHVTFFPNFSVKLK